MADSPSRVLDVGNCDPDHSVIRRMLTQHFKVEIDRVMHVHEAIARMRAGKYDLVLYNRLIFASGAEGIALVHQAKADPELAGAPIMAISNFKEAQDAAVSAGAVRGFGKNSIFEPGTIANLSQYLTPLS